MASRKKQEENHLKILKDLLAQPSNKKCMECDQRGPTYVDVTIGSFVCTSCGGLLRGLNPPHRVKSISMTTFTSQEISFIESRGNEWCRAVYLAKYDEQSKARPESRNDHAKLKHFMELKYEQKRWYGSPSQQRKLMENAAAAVKKSREVTTPPTARPLNSLLGNNINNIQIPSAKPDISKAITQSKVNKPSADLLSDLNPPTLSSPDSLGGFGSPQQTSSSRSSGFNDGFADFDSAFGNFTSAPAPANQATFSAFGQISKEPMPFTNSTSNAGVASGPQNPGQTTAKSNVDKYAALADLFSSDIKTESNDFSWNSPAKSVFSSNQVSSAPVQSVFGSQQQTPQNNLFNSAPISNMNTNPAASSTSWMTTPAAPSWSSSSSQWNPSGATWQPTYQQPAVNPPAPTSNPFFTPAAGQQQQNLFGQPQATATSSDFGPFTQPAGPVMAGYGGASGMSSTNPFATGNAMQPNPGFPAQAMQSLQQPTMNNQSNPFMF